MRNDPEYERHSDFYETERRDVIRRSHALPHIDLLEVVQPSGDFSDKPTRDLVVARTLSRSRFHADSGAGRFTEWSRHRGFVMAPPATYAGIVIDDDHRLDIVSVDWEWLRSVDCEGALPQDGDFGSIHCRTRTEPVLSQLVDALWATQISDDSLQLEAIVAAFIQTLGKWADDSAAGTVNRPERLSPFALKRSLALIDCDDDDALWLADISAAIGLSPYHFCRAFKAATGLPPYRYRIVKRMERARAMLSDPSKQIADVASAVGYNDTAYFSRLFRKETGFSPSEWRREQLW